MIFAESLRGRGTERAIVRLLDAFDRRLVVPELALASAEGEFLEDVPGDIVVHDFGLHGRKTLSAAGPLFRLIAQREPDCVLGVHTAAGRLVALLRLLRPRTPVICYETDLFTKVEAKKGWVPIRRLATGISHRLAARVTAASEAVAEDLRRTLRLPVDKVEVIPLPCVDDSIQTLAAEEISHPAFDGSRPVVVNIGNMHEHKAQDVLLEAFALLLKRREANLVIIGEGPLRLQLEQRARNLGIESSVWFVGFQDNPFKFLSRAQVFVSTAVFEGFDISQVEAMACGVPVIVTDVPRFDAVRHRDSGLLIPPRDPGATTTAIEEVLSDAALATSLTTAARHVAESLSANGIARRYEDLIGSLVNRTNRRCTSRTAAHGSTR